MKIKGSKRGLTFSLQKNKLFDYGTRYRYLVDVKKKEVIIIPDENGKYKVSRKGKEAKPLFDLRNQEIKNLVSTAEYMEVEIGKKAVVVHIFEKTYERVQQLTSSTTSILNFISKADKQSIVIPQEMLQMASGSSFTTSYDIDIADERLRRDMRTVVNVASLFSGAGMFDLPFAKDNFFKFRYALDFEQAACDTYAYNIGNHIVCDDIRKVESKNIPDVDLIIGGICCQGYSNANRHDHNKASGEERRNLVDDYIRLVKEKGPRVFVIENVPQFLTKENSKFLKKILTELSEYEITYQIITDCQVGGYTYRKRMILIGSRIGRIELPNMTVLPYKTVKDALDRVDPTWAHFDDVVNSSEDTIRKIKMVPQGGNYKDIPELAHEEHHSSIYRRLKNDEPAITITNFRKSCILHPTENRIISTAEASSLMGLDGKFVFQGGKSKRIQMVANGVTQAVAGFVKREIKKVFKNHFQRPCFG